MDFNRSSQGLQIQFFHFIGENNAMRISHTDTSDVIGGVSHDQRQIDSLFLCIACHRYLTAFQPRFAHVHANGPYLTLFKNQFGSDDACQRFNTQFGFGRQSIFINIPCETTGYIAAHFGLAAIRIKYPHAKIGNF